MGATLTAVGLASAQVRVGCYSLRKPGLNVILDPPGEREVILIRIGNPPSCVHLSTTQRIRFNAYLIPNKVTSHDRPLSDGRRQSAYFVRRVSLCATRLASHAWTSSSTQPTVCSVILTRIGNLPCDCIS